jgi:quercetin dioxygenase-like cupin family protein
MKNNITFLFVFFTFLVSCQIKNEATVQLPSDVFKLKSDTLGLRSFEVNCKPGHIVPMHDFPENVLYVTEPGTVEYTMEDGSKNISTFEKGQAYIRPAGKAISKNIGTTAVKGVLFHILRPNEIEMAYDSSKDASLVEPSIYQVLAESNNIRVVMATYKAGQTSKLHRHPDYISYVLEGGKTEIIEKDGTKMDGQLIAGTSGVFRGSEHVFKNIDTVSWRVLMIEVNRKFH